MTKRLSRYILSFLVMFVSFLQAQEIDEAALEITNNKIDSLLNVAVKTISSSDYSKSVGLLNKARELAINVKNNKYVGITSHTLSKIYLQADDIKNARLENAKAIAIQKETLDIEGLGQSYITASDIELLEGNYSEAEEFLTLASDQLNNKNRPELLAKIYSNKGIILHSQGAFLESIEQYDLAIKQAQFAQNSYLSARSHAQKAKALLALKNFEAATAAIKEAQEISTTENFSEILLDTYKTSSEIAQIQNDPEAAKQQIDLYQKLEKELNNNETIEILPIENNEAEEALLSQNLTKDISREQEGRLQAKMLGKVLIISMVTILSLLILSLYKNNNLRAKANELLQAKNTELIIAKDNAEKASLVKAQFLSTITHELRTPMYAVTGLTHLLLTENPTEEQKKHLDSLKFSGEYLLSLINNILDLNKLEANKVEVEQTPFSLKKRIEDVLFALGKSAKDKGNKIHLEFDQDIPSELLGDPLMISQILINLVGNAVKFTRDGDVFVRVQKIKQTDQSIALHFEVEDTGEGISKKKQKNIFQNFTQGSVAINRKFGGTGLGLSIVKNLLDLLNSKISLESTLGKGSKFSFDISYSLSQLSAEENNPHNIIYDVDYVALENRKILVVEDNKINQMITRKILEKNKMVCDVADNGEIAVEKVRTEPFDLVLMDIHMPGISGIEATEQIRTFNTEIPILALTAVTIDENIDSFHEAGFNDIIPKPYKVEEFFQKIHNGLKSAKVLS